MPFTLTIDTTNAAFADDPATELGRIFHHLADALPTFLPVAAAGIPVLDSNGNTVGRWSYGAPEVESRLLAEAADSARIAARRFPSDYDAALRYFRDLTSEEGAR